MLNSSSISQTSLIYIPVFEGNIILQRIKFPRNYSLAVSRAVSWRARPCFFFGKQGCREEREALKLGISGIYWYLVLTFFYLRFPPVLGERNLKRCHYRPESLRRRGVQSHQE